jgi:hypothetical protein
VCGGTGRRLARYALLHESNDAQNQEIIFPSEILCGMFV